MPKIVVIDDSKMILILLQRMLEAAGHEVVTLQEITAGEVGERISAEDPALVITDYQMPGCNGSTLVGMARKVKPDLPIIVITASHDPDVVEKLKRQGVGWILFKPIQQAELSRALAEAL